MPAPDRVSRIERQGKAFVVVGPAGSGKSYVARELARRVGGVYLDKDSMASRLVSAALVLAGLPQDGREDEPAYVGRLMPAEYAGLFASAADNLRIGQSVVLDAPFAAYLSDRDFLIASCTAADWPPDTRIVVVKVQAGEETVRARLTDRALPRDRAKLADWNRFWGQLGAQDCHWEGALHIVIHNDVEPNLEEALGLAETVEASASRPALGSH